MLMKGNNKLVLCEATVIFAMQEWVNKNMLAPRPKVKGVSQQNSGEFVVLLSEQEFPAAEADAG